MSAAASLDFTYRYPFASSIGDTQAGFGLRLATCGATHEHPRFFEGRLRRPRETGCTLIALSDVVRTHYFLPVPMQLDPVVTSSESMLRFEGFSGCCGVYARVDMLPEAFETELQGRGTTNVDFNNPMRAALTRLRDRDDARLAVGADEVSLSREGEAAVEKKVKLPVRWIKGFSEVQAYQPGLSLKLEVPAAEARRFVRSLPRGGAPKTPSYVTQMGRALRLSQRAKPGAVRLLGTHRLRALDPLMSSARGLRIWADDDAGTSGWEVLFDSGRFFLMLSPEVYRGFSGEGQVLEALGSGKWEAVLPRVQTHLNWQNEVDASELARLAGAAVEEVEAALAALGARGLAGYDVTTGAYFHRELPFELERVEQLQPRLKGARRLLEKKGVEALLRHGEGSVDLGVAGTGVTHHVRLRPEGDKCTCPWYSKHQGQRGPCKHILAGRMLVEAEESEAGGGEGRSPEVEAFRAGEGAGGEGAA
jgi:hypothetical protein